KKAAVAGERQLDFGDEVAALIIAEERLRSRRRELDRPAELARCPQHQAELDEDAVAGAEIPAHGVGKHAHAFGRTAEKGGKLALLPHGAAAAGVQRVAPASCIILTKRGV